MLVFVLCLPLCAWAENIEFYQTVETDRVGLVDTFELTVVVGETSAEAQLELTSSPDFDVISKSEGQQTQISLGGGGSRFRKQHIYTLLMQPKKAGVFILPPSVLKVGTKIYKTESLRVEVEEGKQAKSARQRRNLWGMPDLFDSQMDEFFGGTRRSRNRMEPASVRLVATLEKPEVYVGEQVNLTLSIVSSVDLSSVDSFRMPKLDGFWSEDIDSPKTLVPQEEESEGVRRQVYVVRRLALFPTRSGEITIAPVDAEISAGLGFQSQRIHRLSEPLTLRVKPLPQGAPPDFSSQNVGSFRVRLEIKEKTVTLGNPFSAKLRVEGTGNLKNLRLPELELPTSLRAFDPTQIDDFRWEQARFTGSRTREYLLVPQARGEVEIPSVEFHFFNPETGRYESAFTQSTVLNVLPSEGAAKVTQKTAQAAASWVPAIQGKQEALAPIRVHMHTGTPWNPVFWLWAFVLPPVAWLVSGAWVQWRRKSHANSMESRAGLQALKQRMAQLEALTNAGTGNEFFAELQRVLFDFLESQTKTACRGLSREQLFALLKENNVQEGLIQGVTEILETCEWARYSPTTQSSSMKDVLSRVLVLMQRWSV